jgi:hypothetical protein
LRLYLLGEELEIIIDDFIPCNSEGEVAFARCTSGIDDIWPCLVEKGFAKIFGRYENLIAGFSMEAFGILTGAPTESLVH